MAKKGIYQRYVCDSTTQWVRGNLLYNDEGTHSYYGYDNTVIYNNYIATENGYKFSTDHKTLYDLKDYYNEYSEYRFVTCKDSGYNGQLEEYTYPKYSSGKSGNYPSDYPFGHYRRWDLPKQETLYSRGTYLNDIISDYDSLPANGRHTDGYWYVFVKMASNLKVNDKGFWRDIPTGWANDKGFWKPQNELKSNINGIYK